MKNRTRILVSSVLLGSLSLTACGSGGEGEEDWESELVSAGTLSIGTSGNYAPYAMQQGGETVGYSIDQCVELADRLGLEPEIHVLDFNGAMTGLSAGNYDVVCSGELAHTEERLEATTFMMASPTMEDGTGLITLSDNPDAVDNVDDIPEGTTVGGIQGGAQPVNIENYLEDRISLDLYPGLTEAIEGLRQGRNDYVTAGRLVLLYIESQNDDLTVIDGNVAVLPGSFAVAPNDAMFEAIDEASQEMVEDGFIEELQMEWFDTTSLLGESD